MAQPLTGQAQLSVSLWVEDLLRHKGVKVRRNYRFHPTRKFEFDIAILEWKIGIEVDGFGGGHQLPKGFIRDREKDLEAAIIGWRVLRLSTAQVRDGSAFDYLDRIFGAVSPTVQTPPWFDPPKMES